MSNAVRRTPWSAKTLTATMLSAAVFGWSAAAGAAAPVVAAVAATSPAAAPSSGPGRPLSLVQAQRLLIEGNPQLQASRLALEAARADVKTALEAPNPQFSWNSTSMNFHDGLGRGAPWDKRVDSIFRIDQQIERGNKRELRGKVATKEADAVAADVEDTSRTSRLSVAGEYYDLKASQEALTIANDLVMLQRQSLDAANLRLHAGSIADVDVARLQVEVARAEADLADAQTAHRAAQIALAQLLGLPTDTAQFEASDDWPAVSVRFTAESTVDQRPDVRAAQERVGKAESAVALAKSQLTHDVTIGAQYERHPQPDIGPNTWGIGFSVPLFLRNHYEGEMARAAADRRSAQQQLQQTRQVAQADRDLAVAQLDGAAQRVRKFQDEVVTQARKASDDEEYAYSRGALGLTDLLDARRALQAVLLDAVAAHAGYAKALEAWRAATNTGTELPAAAPAN